MARWFGALALSTVFLFGATAWGQGEEPAPEVTPEPTPTPEEPVVEPADPMANEDSPDDANRPRPRSVAIGAGWALFADTAQLDTDRDGDEDVSFPSVSFAPDTLSVRMTWGRIDLEPFITGGLSRGTTEVEVPGTDTTDKVSANFVGGGALGRYAFLTRGPVDFQALGLARVTWTSTRVDPDGAANAVDDQLFQADVSYGGAVEWFASSRFSVSLEATNPLFTFVNQVTDDAASDSVTRNSNTTVELTWDPTLRAAVHLWF